MDLRYTAPGRLVVCIPCANSKREDGELWDNPDVPREAAQAADPSQRYRVVPPADALPDV
ncbi:MAG: hypothetical protein OXC12_06810 [Spirochaetaceae bacterium]|nr:hypothetical protein [Spirochaetaceae bacterium]